MINFEKQFENFLKKYKEIENDLSNQNNFDPTKLVKLNKEYAELKPIVERINLLEPKYRKMTDGELQNQTKFFKEKLTGGISNSEILEDAQRYEKERRRGRRKTKTK